MKAPVDFEARYAQLMIEMNECLNEPENDRSVIEDGTMRPEEYFANEIRLAWMLKEPYDGDDGTGGGWKYHDMFVDDDLYGTFSGGHRSTWHPIIYVTYSIYNGFLRWDELPYIRDKHEMCDVVRETAFINIQKLPAKGVTRTNHGDLWDAMRKCSDLLLRQVEMLDPNVLIFGNTMSLYLSLPEFKDVEVHKRGSVEFFVRNEKLYINAYHPAQTTISRQAYCDDIISLVQQWSEGELK